MNDDNKDDILGDGGKATYDPATNTLTLDDPAIENMYVDDAADLFDEMPANVVTRLLAKTSAETRRTINQLLKYPDDSAGSLMTTEYEALKLHLKVSEALQKIKNDGIDKETINTCYVIDRNRKLLGTVTLRSLLFADPDIEVGDIMTEN